MSDARQPFTNNFDQYESNRFNVGIAMLMMLYSKDNRYRLNEKIKKQLIDVQTIDDGSQTIKGLTYHTKDDEMHKWRIYYVKADPNKIAYSWHMMLHELSHFMGELDEETLQNELDNSSNTINSRGAEIMDFDANIEYGSFFNECGADLLCEIAMTTSEECRKTNPEIKSADDIIYTNNRYSKTNYDSLSTIARLMTVAMDNNFTGESYDSILYSENNGLLNGQVQMINSKTGETIANVPLNDYLYGMTGNGKHIEKQFDKYSYDGSYKEMCLFLDKQTKILQEDINKYSVDKNKIKEQLLRIADMVNNKVNYLQNNNVITPEQRNSYVGKFNRVFNQALTEYGIGALNQEDIIKLSHTTSHSQVQQETISNNNYLNGESTEYIKSTITSGYHIEHNGEYYTNPKGEIIRPFDGDIVIMAGKYGYTNQYGQIVRYDQIRQYQENSINGEIENYRDLSQTKEYLSSGLSFSQKIALFLQRRKLLMKVPIIENYVNNQLKLLPEPKTPTEVIMRGQERQKFLKWITRDGKLRQFPQLSIMHDPAKQQHILQLLEEQRKNNFNGR